jgi:hypothetical protein
MNRVRRLTTLSEQLTARARSKVGVSWVTDEVESLGVSDDIVELSRSVSLIASLSYAPLSQALSDRVNHAVASNKGSYIAMAARIDNEEAVECIIGLAPLAIRGEPSGDLLLALLGSTVPRTPDQLSNLSDALSKLKRRSWAADLLPSLRAFISYAKADVYEDVLALSALASLINRVRKYLPEGYGSIGDNVRWIDGRIADRVKQNPENVGKIPDWVARSQNELDLTQTSAEAAATILNRLAKSGKKESVNWQPLTFHLSRAELGFACLPELLPVSAALPPKLRDRLLPLLRPADLPAEQFLDGCQLLFASGRISVDDVFDLLEDRIDEIPESQGFFSVIGPWTGRDRLLLKLSPNPTRFPEYLAVAISMAEAGLEISAELKRGLAADAKVHGLRLDLLARWLNVLEIVTVPGIDPVQAFAEAFKLITARTRDYHLFARLIEFLPPTSPYSQKLASLLGPEAPLTTKLRLAKTPRGAEDILRLILPTYPGSRASLARLVPAQFLAAPPSAPFAPLRQVVAV